MNTILESVAKNIVKYRNEQGITQSDLAKLLKVNRSYISNLEKGRNLSILTLEKIAKVLSVDITLLFENIDLEALGNRMEYIPGLIDKKQKNWKGRSWYHQRFDGCPYLIHMIAEAEIQTRREMKGNLSFNHHFCFYNEGRADWYIDISEIERISNRVIEEGEKDPKFIKKLIKTWKVSEDIFYAKCDEIGKLNLRKLSNSELISLHDNFVDLILDRNSSSSIIDGFALGTDVLLETKLKEIYRDSVFKNKVPFVEFFTHLTSPRSTSFIREVEIDLFKLVLAIKKARNKKTKLIEEYRAKYFWIRNNYTDAYVPELSYYENEIARLESSHTDIEKELKNLLSDSSSNQKNKKMILSKINISKAIRFLVETTEDFTLWQDERKKATLFTAHYTFLILKEIAARIDIPLNLLKFMSPREISNVFKKTPDRNILENRYTETAEYWDTEGHEMITGKEAQKIKMQVLGERTQNDINDFRGMSASLGKARGTVKILRSAKEIDSIKEGDILVTVMTRPDYVPAMRKAAAIVTDEGGITSHAAIVSRELKKPCIIGTKIATHVLKDGDIVEVDANHGVVKILK